MNDPYKTDFAALGLPTQPGVNCFGMLSIKKPKTQRDLALESRRVSSKAKRERQSRLTKAQISALAMRSPEERAADRRDAILARKGISAFNVELEPSAILGASAKARARAGI